MAHTGCSLRSQRPRAGLACRSGSAHGTESRDVTHVPFSNLSTKGDSSSPVTCVSASLAEFTLTVERGRRPAGLHGLGCQQETDGPPVSGSVPVAAELGHGGAEETRFLPLRGSRPLLWSHLSLFAFPRVLLLVLHPPDLLSSLHLIPSWGWCPWPGPRPLSRKPPAWRCIMQASSHTLRDAFPNHSTDLVLLPQSLFTSHSLSSQHLPEIIFLFVDCVFSSNRRWALQAEIFLHGRGKSRLCWVD